MEKLTLPGRLTGLFVHLFERLLPDPFVFAILLSLATAVLAMLLAPNGSGGEVLTAWCMAAFSQFLRSCRKDTGFCHLDVGSRAAGRIHELVRLRQTAYRGGARP